MEGESMLLLLSSSSPPPPVIAGKCGCCTQLPEPPILCPPCHMTSLPLACPSSHRGGNHPLPSHPRGSSPALHSSSTIGRMAHRSLGERVEGCSAALTTQSGAMVQCFALYIFLMQSTWIALISVNDKQGNPGH